MENESYRISLPATLSSCIVFASPHSGRDYDRDFVQNTILNGHTIRSSEDAFVDRLFAAAPHHGAALIAALVPRAFVDLNRSPDDLDPALIDGIRLNRRNTRIASGLGVIPRVVAGGRSIYADKLPLQEARARIAHYWKPYHAALHGLLDRTHQIHGQAVLIDCHSMPHEAMNGSVRKGVPRPDVVLGDRHGTAAAPDVVDAVEAAFRAANFTVVRNTPFAGAYTVGAYGRPMQNRHAVQVEIDRALYMDEARITPHAGFPSLCERLKHVIAGIVRIGGTAFPLAAE